MEHIYGLATLWVALALLATFAATWLRISSTLCEIIIGIGAGFIATQYFSDTALGSTEEWLKFLASSGAVILTFLAGAELDPDTLRAKWKEVSVIGLVGFSAPFLGCAALARLVLGWSAQSSLLAGVALSTTSMAVVYAVMLETGFNQTDYGKGILGACFINDLGTVIMLGLLFAPFTLKTLIFVVSSLIVFAALPTVTPRLLHVFGGKPTEVETKFILFVLFGLGALAVWSGSEAVLPAYLVGLVVAGVFLRDKTLVHRMRSIAFAMFTPFYFIKAGLYVSLPSLWPALAIVAGLLLLKMMTKTIGVWPLARLHYMRPREAAYTTLLMATGLTFGTISALFGYQNKIIDQRQYTILVTVVILSALVPTLFAQKLFQPSKQAMHAWGRLYRRRLGVLSVEDREDINNDISE